SSSVHSGFSASIISGLGLRFILPYLPLVGFTEADYANTTLDFNTRPAPRLGPRLLLPFPPLPRSPPWPNTTSATTCSTPPTPSPNAAPWHRAATRSPATAVRYRVATPCWSPSRAAATCICALPSTRSATSSTRQDNGSPPPADPPSASWPFTTGRSTATAAGPSSTSSSPSMPASARPLNSRQPKPALPNWAGARQRRATSAPPARPEPEPINSKVGRLQPASHPDSCTGTERGLHSPNPASAETLQHAASNLTSPAHAQTSDFRPDRHPAYHRLRHHHPKPAAEHHLPGGMDRRSPIDRPQPRHHHLRRRRPRPWPCRLQPLVR